MANLNHNDLVPRRVEIGAAGQEHYNFWRWYAKPHLSGQSFQAKYNSHSFASKVVKGPACHCGNQNRLPMCGDSMWMIWWMG